MPKHRQRGDRSRGQAPAADKPERGPGQRSLLGWSCLLGGLYLLLACSYALTTPVDRAPDESAHRVYVQWLAEHRRLPVFDPADEQHYELHQPPLYYALCVPLYLTSRASHGPERVTRLMRLVNVALGLAFLLATLAFARHLLPGRPWTALGVAGFVAFLPMQLALCASLNNDVLLQAFAAAVLWLLARQLRVGGSAGPNEPRGGASTSLSLAPPRAQLRGGFSLWQMAAVGMLTGLGLLTKSQAVFLFPVIWLAVGVGLWNRDLTARRALGLAAVATVVALAVGGWWLVRNQSLYGDALAMRVFTQAFVGSRPTPQEMMAATGLSATQYVVRWVLWWTFRSFWGMFGPRATGRFVFYPPGVYWGLAALSLAALVGLVKWLRAPEERTARQLRALLAPALLGALVAASFVRFNMVFFQAQGRYLFPALPLWALLFMVGLEQLAPRRARPRVTLAVVACLFLLAAAGLSLVRSLGGLRPALPASSLRSTVYPPLEGLPFTKGSAGSPAGRLEGFSLPESPVNRKP